MLRDITLGQYYPTKSVIHRLDPRVKLAGTMLYIIALFINQSYLGYAWAILFFALTVYISKVPFSFIIRGLKGIIILLLFSVSLNVFFTDGRVLVQLWRLRITYEGVEKAIFMGIRIALLIIGSSLMTLTTTPNALTDGLETGLGFLKKIRVPVHDLAMMMSIALRFIPILTEELDKIMKAQTARGADFETGNIVRRAKNMVPLLVPLLVSAFRRASDLAMAMDARCYHGGEGRTKMYPLRYTKQDVFAYICIFIYFLVMIGIRKGI